MFLFGYFVISVKIIFFAPVTQQSNIENWNFIPSMQT